MLFAYFGPETFLPVTSVVAGVVGVLLMFGKNTFRLLASGLRGLLRPRSRREPRTFPAPHFTQNSAGLDRRHARSAGPEASGPDHRHGS
jgi:hypothetical protein